MMDTDDINTQAPNKYVKGEKYWFFKFFKNAEVDVLDYQEGFVFHRIEKKLLKNYFYQSFKAFLRRDRYDVVISHGAQSGLFYSLFSTIFQKKGPLHVIIDIGGLNGARINKYETPLIRFALRNQPSIIYHAKPQIKLYETAYPELVSKTKFVRFGVDNVYFMPLGKQTEDYILTFGFLKRDNETLIRAWKNINKNNTKLYILGVEGESDDSIIYFGKVDMKTLIDKISRCLFVVVPLPVYNYSYGQMSFLQSMALGKPVVVTNTPSTNGYLEDGKGTFYVKPYDIKDMEEKISYLLSNKDKLEELGLQARTQVDECLNEQIMAEQIDEFIREQQLNRIN